MCMNMAVSGLRSALVEFASASVQNICVFETTVKSVDSFSKMAYNNKK